MHRQWKAFSNDDYLLFYLLSISRQHTGNKGLEKEWVGAAEMAKSKTMSAKNAWGKSTGYAEELINQGMEATRAQQMENWKNQQEVLHARQQQRYMTEEFDKVGGDEDWRSLSNYAGERVDDTDLDKLLGDVTPGSTIYHHIELTSRIGQPKIMEFDITVRWFIGFTDVLEFIISSHGSISFLDARCFIHLFQHACTRTYTTEFVHGIFRFPCTLYTRNGLRLVRRTHRG